MHKAPYVDPVGVIKKWTLDVSVILNPFCGCVFCPVAVTFLDSLNQAVRRVKPSPLSWISCALPSVAPKGVTYLIASVEHYAENTVYAIGKRGGPGVTTSNGTSNQNDLISTGHPLERFSLEAEKGACMHKAPYVDPSGVIKKWTLDLSVILNPFWWLCFLIRGGDLPRFLESGGQKGTTFTAIMDRLRFAFSCAEGRDFLIASVEHYAEDIVYAMCRFFTSAVDLAPSMIRIRSRNAAGEETLEPLEDHEVRMQLLFNTHFLTPLHAAKAHVEAIVRDHLEHRFRTFPVAPWRELRLPRKLLPPQMKQLFDSQFDAANRASNTKVTPQMPKSGVAVDPRKSDSPRVKKGGVKFSAMKKFIKENPELAKEHDLVTKN
jgi:hypothetical protein